MALKEYHGKRHFDRTAEPEGKLASAKGRSYVIQKHHASHLHYDFRLELDGVLKSWAVPKGPSLNPATKRLAVQVEDHPVQYGSFEGTIPAGEYGGGTVMLWDTGTWEPLEDPEEGYRKGRLRFALHGRKLRGGWKLIRTGKAAADGSKRQWLLFKERDGEADEEEDILEEMRLSATTGRDLEEIAAGAPKKKVAKPKAVKAPKRNAVQPKAVALPKRIDVELATLVREAPEGDDWLHEIKFDGYRMIGRLSKGKASFVSRNHKDWTRRMPALAESLKQLPVDQAIFDGEVVALRPDGTSDFQELQNAFKQSRAEALVYYVFDLLHLNGQDVRSLPLEKRKGLLAQLLKAKSTPTSIRYSEHVVGNGPAFFEEAAQKGLEGIVSKRRDSAYESGRGGDWVKTKCVNREEFVIGGYTDPEGSRTGLGALLVGYYGDGDVLVYAGRVGTGFNAGTLRLLIKRLGAHKRKDSPFTDFRKEAHTHWVEPKLVAQIAFAAWTRDNQLRHASFQGLREDKPAGEVTRARPLAKVPAGKRVAPERMVMASASRTTRRDEKPDELAGVRFTHPDKLLYAEEGITKREVAEYLQAVAPWMLPLVAGRPLMLVRCPDGQSGQCFYQKHPGQGTLETLRRIDIGPKGRSEEYALVDDAAGLISLAQMSVLEIHAWGSREDKLEQPDRIVFDLDPAENLTWRKVVDGAFQVKELLQALGLKSFAKTTGGKGLHLVVPIERRLEWDEVAAFCKRVADAIAAADPRRYTANMSKAARPGKIFIDYLRNSRGATSVAPYSMRARPGATVSLPVGWRELKGDFRPDQWTIRTVPRRLKARRGDPWEGIASLRQSLTGPIRKLDTVM